MELRARIRPFSRRAAFAAASVALFASAVAGAFAPSAHAAKKKKAPVITSIAPKDVAVGEALTIRGRYFIPGRNKNTVVFKRDGARAVFVKAPVGTKKLLRVTVPASLQEFFALNAGTPVPTRFRLRVLAQKFGKKFTSNKLSPIVSAPRPPQNEKPRASLPDGDCDGDGDKNRTDADDDNDGLTDAVELSLSLDPCVADTDGDGLLDKWEFDCDRNGVLNRDESDDDKDLLSDSTETAIGTNPCALDTDGDGIEDGYEMQSATDLNNDEYQEPNFPVLYPSKAPYPNALFSGDANIDFDGDSLTLAEEQRLWKYTYTVNHKATRTLAPLSYSDGMQHSLFEHYEGDRRRPAQPTATYPAQQEFVAWASANNYLQVKIPDSQFFGAGFSGMHDIRDADFDGSPDLTAADYDNDGFVSDEERDEDSDGLTNFDETTGRMLAKYWTGCYSTEAPWPTNYAGTKVDDPDTDGDGVRGGADDQDHDDLPNLMELSRVVASGGLDDREPGARPCTPDEDLLELDLDLDGEVDDPLLWHSNVYGRVNPFNPCMPFKDSRTCPWPIVNLDNPAAPFDGSPDWFSLN
jgi:hypothetical protein